MQPQPPSSVRSRDLERVRTFIDAVVAVALTLFILPLVDRKDRRVHPFRHSLHG